MKICDRFFAHTHSIATEVQLPQRIIWDRNVRDDDNIVFYTENFGGANQGKIKIAILLESPVVTPHLYNAVRDPNISNKFDYIFTFDDGLLALGNKFVPFYLGGCWIKGSDIDIHPKTRGVSIIASDKTQYPGHKLRHDIVRSCRNKIDFICGRGYQRIDNKIQGLKDFGYSIVVENVIADCYFSEKLTDCFSTGTIPIYWGCKSIGKFFDTNGIYTFDSIDQLNHILGGIGPEDYLSRIQYVRSNFEICKQYQVCENIIAKELEKRIPFEILKEYKLG